MKTEDTNNNPFVEPNQADRIEAKKDRALERADNADANSAALFNQARSKASVIPFGQPILVGHHSEKRDRKYRESISNTYGKAFAETEKADHYRNKAKGIGTGGISSTSPTALQELKDKLESLVANQERMKAINAEYKKGGLDGITSATGSLLESIKRTMSSDRRMHDKPFPSYSLKNNNANIRTTKKRIEELETLHSTEAPKHRSDDFDMYVDDGRIHFDFHGEKPNEEARSKMKGTGRAFIFSRYSSTWVRKVTPNALRAAQTILKDLQAMENIF